MLFIYISSFQLSRFSQETVVICLRKKEEKWKRKTWLVSVFNFEEELKILGRATQRHEFTKYIKTPETPSFPIVNAEEHKHLGENKLQNEIEKLLDFLH